MKSVHPLVILLAFFFTGLCHAQEASPSPAASAPTTQAAPDAAESDPGLAVIRSGAQAFVDAFNQGDAAAVANCWTVDGEYVDDSGNSYTGRAEIEQAYTTFFKDNPGAKIQISVDNVKLFSDAAAIEQGSTLVRFSPTSGALGRYVAYHVKVDGKWQMASVRDVLIEVSVEEQNLADLDWLVGTWVAEERGNKSVSVCHWINDRSFVQRDFTTTLFDGTKSSGVQIIGWNPLEEHVQSWTFSADGGHDVGHWEPTDDGWAAQMQGTTGDGLPTSAINLLRRLDDNAYVWQSINRSVGGMAVPDTDEVVIRRQPVTK